ncbi:MAG: WecB/TagA/CpsF family glycosyltransferase [Defluviimonas sp.]|nr:WecB/TagA/CpsF family glycosyltransferase [Defluviimonas sp.]
MTLRFTRRSLEEWIAFLIARAAEPGFGYMVTPNVDHIVQLLGGKVDRTAYGGAETMMNDSRILAKLARLAGKTLPALPGANLVEGLLAHPAAGGLTIAVIGPSRRDFEALAARYPDASLGFVPAPPGLSRDCPEWERLLNDVAAADFDILLSCLSFPKQEYLVHDLQRRGIDRGFAICAGASIDYLTGRQERAPELWQRLSLEWAHRLLTNPRRMWRRYLVDGPRIFSLFLRHEIWTGAGVEIAPSAQPAMAGEGARGQ